MYLISKKLDYALRALTYLTSLEPGAVTLARDIAKHQVIPMRFLQKIMKDLVDKRIVRSYQGPGGGYALARSPKAITLKDVMEAVEGPIGLMECSEGDPGCGIYGHCPQIPSWQDLQSRFIDILNNKTLVELSGAYKKPQFLPTSVA